MKKMLVEGSSQYLMLEGKQHLHLVALEWFHSFWVGTLRTKNIRCVRQTNSREIELFSSDARNLNSVTLASMVTCCTHLSLVEYFYSGI